MIVLDTNVLSELTRRVPEPEVLSWLDALPAEEICTTAITAAELLYGVGRLPAGRRRTTLLQAVDDLLHVDLAGRVEPFDLEAAADFAILVSDRERTGRPISVADAQIASICRVRGHSLATRNTKDFVGTEVTVINPWNG